MTQGLKFDQDKLAYHLVDDDADAEMTAVLTFGAVKYEPGNWAKVEGARDRYYAAVRRHLHASRKGEVLDPEHGLFTLASAACCIHFLLALELREHPELTASLPKRLRGALEVAKTLRGKRPAEPPPPPSSVEASPDGWEWIISTLKGKRLASGRARSIATARLAAREALGKRRGKIKVSFVG